jgi:hypothetical protein
MKKGEIITHPKEILVLPKNYFFSKNVPTILSWLKFIIIVPLIIFFLESNFASNNGDPNQNLKPVTFIINRGKSC